MDSSNQQITSFIKLQNTYMHTQSIFFNNIININGRIQGFSFNLSDRNLWFHSSHGERLLEAPLCLLQRWSSTASTSPFLTCSPYGPPLLCREPLALPARPLPDIDRSPFCHYCSFESCCSPP